VNEQLLQQILGLLLGQLGMGQGSSLGAAMFPPSGTPALSPAPDAFSVEPDELIQNAAQNVSPAELLPPSGGAAAPSGYPSGYPAALQSGPAMFGGAGGAAGALGGPSGGVGGALGATASPQASSSSDFDFKAAGSAVSGAMGKLAEGIAQQGQQANQAALKLMSDNETDPRLAALMRPISPLPPLAGLGGGSDVGQAALQQLLSLFLPQR
jgi:hypothetical protein